MSLLSMTIYFNQVELTRKLIERGADVDFIDSNGSTVLHWATVKKSALLDELANQMKNKNVVDKLGNTPLSLRQELW